MNKVFLALRCAAVIAIVAAAFASDWALANHYILCERAQKCIVVEPPLVDSGTSIDANIPDRVCPCDFGVAQIYSNADGSIQFVQISQVGDRGASLAGKTLAIGGHAYDEDWTVEFGMSFPRLARGDLLIATKGFAALGLVQPDVVVPNHFLPLRNGSLRLQGVDWLGGPVRYDALPVDGVSSLYPNIEGDVYARPIVDTAMAVNDRGDFHVFGPIPKLTALWSAVDQPGWGLAVEHQGERILALWATHDQGGDPTWYAMQATRWDATHPEQASGRGNPNRYVGTIYQTIGTEFGGLDARAPPADIGSVSLEFFPNEAIGGIRVQMPSSAGRTIAFSKVASPFLFGTPAPVCLDGAEANSATTRQGLWWNGAESGWGLHITHQTDDLFAVWFTYDDRGKPTWFSFTAKRDAQDAYEGVAYRTKGPPYDTGMYDVREVVNTGVGIGRFTFRDAAHGTFDYTINGKRGQKAIERQMFGATPAFCH